MTQLQTFRHVGYATYPEKAKFKRVKTMKPTTKTYRYPKRDKRTHKAEV